MEFGIFSNGERANQLAADSYDEDLYEIVVADKLGLKEAWVSEHVPRGDGSSRPDTVPVADLLICKAAAVTKQPCAGNDAVRGCCGVRCTTVEVVHSSAILP